MMSRIMMSKIGVPNYSPSNPCVINFKFRSCEAGKVLHTTSSITCCASLAARVGSRVAVLQKRFGRFRKYLHLPKWVRFFRPYELLYAKDRCIGNYGFYYKARLEIGIPYQFLSYSAGWYSPASTRYKNPMHISSVVLSPHPTGIGGLCGFAGLLAELSKCAISETCVPAGKKIGLRK